MEVVVFLLFITRLFIVIFFLILIIMFLGVDLFSGDSL